jgi:hypothetical protein
MSTKPQWSVGDAIEQALVEGREALTRRGAALDRIGEELGHLHRAQENLMAQIRVLSSRREEIVGQGSGIVVVVQHRSHEVLYEALAVQREGLGTRIEQIREQRALREQQVLQTLRDGEFTDRLVEYEQFKNDIEPNLANLPASYRSVVLGHHQEVSEVLANHVKNTLSRPVEVKADRLNLDVVIAFDPVEENNCALIIVLPICGEVADDWRSRTEDMQSALAYRVIQGVLQLVKRRELSFSGPVVGSHRSFFVMEMDLGYSGSLDDLKVALTQQIDLTLHDAVELRASAIFGKVCEVDVDVLLPQEDADSTELATEIMAEREGAHA